MNETYPEGFEEMIRQEGFSKDVQRISMRDISGTDMYLSDEARDEIIKRLDKIRDPELGIHFIDSGNYHYLSGIFTSFIKVKYDLVLIDHHTDMQETAFGNILSCGSWASEVIEKDENVRSFLLCGPVNAGGGTHADMDVSGKNVTCMIFGEGNSDPDIPVYISVDKDVLCEDECVTNWDQGEMTLSELSILIKKIANGRKVIGADICGGISGSDPRKNFEASKKNTASDLYIYRLLGKLMSEA